MRKKVAITMAVAIIVLTAGVIILRGKMPYKDLKASDIVSATVYFFPPDKTVQITDVEELVSYLGEVTIYNEDHSYNDYCGQTVLFTLTMADGAQEKITAFNPFVIINGVGYKAKYEPCERLSRYCKSITERWIKTMIFVVKEQTSNF